MRVNIACYVVNTLLLRSSSCCRISKSRSRQILLRRLSPKMNSIFKEFTSQP